MNNADFYSAGYGASCSTWHGTTILAVRGDNEIVLGGDGQVSIGATIVKSTANKLRRLAGGEVIGGFAGSTADALTLFERFESKLESYPKQLVRAAVEMAKDWRMDKYLRRLEAMMIVANKTNTLLISGSGDVLEPEENAIAIGSGGNYALAAAKAFLLQSEKLDCQEIVLNSMKIASDICVYTNNNIKIEKISW